MNTCGVSFFISQHHNAVVILWWREYLHTDIQW